MEKYYNKPKQVDNSDGTIEINNMYHPAIHPAYHNMYTDEGITITVLRKSEHPKN